MLTASLMICLLGASDALPKNTDAFYETVRDEPLATLPARERALVDHGHVGRLEPRLGVPTIFWAMRVGPAAPGWTRVDLTPTEAARRYLLEYAPLYRLSGLEVAKLTPWRVHDLGVGALVVSFTRELDGVPLFRDAVNVVMTRKRELVAVTGFVNPNGAKLSAKAAFRLPPTIALELAARDAVGLALAGTHVAREADAAGWVRLDAGRLQVARARRVWYGLADALEAAWQVELADGAGNAFLEVISARDGRVLSRKNQTEEATASYRVWASTTTPFAPADSPFGTELTPHPTGVRLPPLASAELPASLVTLDYGPSPRTDPWLAAGTTTLAGNNVEAYADVNEPDGFNPPDASLPDGGVVRLRDGGLAIPDPLTPVTSAMTFDTAYDFDAGPEGLTQVYAATTQLFFTANWVHDWLYAYGFDEASGNGQRDNFGRGGQGNDPIHASAMDYSRPNNATMSTFGDGEGGNMQMGNFSGHGPWWATLTPQPDGGAPTAGRSNLGPAVYDVSAALAVMAVDGGFDGCDDLLDPASIDGRVAFVFGSRCPVDAQVARAQDAGAVGVLLGLAPQAPGSYGGYLAQVANPTMPPTMALAGRVALDVFASLDAGVPVTARLYSASAPPRPTALDSSVSVHELGHFLSNRLISDAAGLSLPISRSLGEGWSDFLALMAMVRESDALAPANAGWQGSWAMGAWVTAGTTSLGVPTEYNWLGIRREPYSVDPAKNGLSFRHIRDGASLPASSVAFGLNSEVHNSGEVWTTMLWECFVALLEDRQLPFSQAHPLMMRTLIGALKATPPNPDFLEARDAVLAVALAEDPQTFQAMYRAFARRGAGPRAVAPSKLSTGNSPVIEDTTTDDFVKVTQASADDSVVWCDKDGVLDVGETGVLHLVAKNLGTSAVSAPIAVQVVPVTPGVSIVGDPNAIFSPAAPFGTTEASVQVRLDAATTVQQLEFRIDVPGSTTTLPTLVTVLSNWDLVTGRIEDFEGNVALDRGTGWRRGDDLVVGSASNDDRWLLTPLTPTSTVLHGPDARSPGRTWTTPPALEVGPAGFTIRFKHRWDMEFSNGIWWDGTFLEVSDDGQQTWTKVASTELSPPYNGVISSVTIGTQPNTNPGAGQDAWVAKSAAFPAWVTQTVSFGTRFAGKTVHLRFVSSTDPNTGVTGWDVDDVEAQGITNAPFTQRVTDRKQCINRAPTVTVPFSTRVDERSTVTLQATVNDVDGDALTIRWAQKAGPPVTLTGDTFVAPEVTQDLELTFEVTVSDATKSASAQTKIIVGNANRAPEVVATGPSTVHAGQVITLEATATDADGDPVALTWVQTRGPLAKERSPGVYEAPATKEAARLVFEVSASDGKALTTADVEVGLDVGGCGCDAGGGSAVVLAIALWELVRRRRRR